MVPAGSRSTIVVWAIAAVVATVAVMRILGDDQPTPAAINVSGAPAAGPQEGGSASRGIYVHVAGAVRRPGLMRLPPGSRVAVALQRAGGPSRRADLTGVNLAARLQDGQQIVVPAGRAAAGASGPRPAGAASGPAGGKVHLSSATIEELDGVDGIGPTLAQRIIEYRDAHGGFRSLGELAQVEGIGEKRLATLREALQP